MFTFSRSKLTTLMAGLTLVAAGNMASAGDKINGVVENVNPETNSITVTTEKTGEVKTYAFPGIPRIDMDGRKLSEMSALEPGQEVTLKFADIEEPKPESPVQAVILRIDHEQRTALIRPTNGGARRVIELPENVSVAGLYPGATLKDLQRDQVITLKYSAR